MVASSLHELVKNGRDVRSFFLLDNLEVLVVVNVTELNQLKHDLLLWILELLVALFHVSRLDFGLFDLFRYLLGSLRRHDDWVHIHRRLLSCSWPCFIDRATTTGIVADFKGLLDAHHVVKLTLIFELSNYDVILFKVVVTKVLHKEESLAHLPVGRICGVPAGRECLLKLITICLWLKAYVVQGGRLASILLDRLRRRLQDGFRLRWLLRLSLYFFSRLRG